MIIEEIPFGKRLNCLLRNKGIRQADLADKVYVTESCISRYISGRVYPGIPTLVLIAKTLNVSTDYLLGLTSGKIENSVLNEKEQP